MTFKIDCMFLPIKPNLKKHYYENLLETIVCGMFVNHRANILCSGISRCLPDSWYDTGSGNKGFLRRINQNGTEETKIFAVQTMYSGAFRDLFRITTTGNATIANPRYDGYTSLQFYSSILKYGELNTRNSAFNLSSPYGINFYPTNEASPVFTMSREAFGIKAPILFYPDRSDIAILKIYSGINNDPIISRLSPGWLRIGSPSGIAFWADGQENTNNDPHLYIGSSGNIGIGTTSGTAKLNVGGKILTSSSGVTAVLGGLSEHGDSWLGTSSNHGLHIGTNGTSYFYIDVNQNTYIGINHTEADQIRADLKSKYRLFVTKGILSEDYAIGPKSSWSDYVFDSEYQLRTIEELETFIKTNKHLPNVPSAKEVATEGYSQHEMNKALLEKVEELSLYIIKLQKEVELLKSLK